MIVRKNFKVRIRSGAIVPLVAILIPLLFAIAGFGLYIASAQLIRTELRSSVDFASRAGVRQLSLNQSTSAAIAAARDVASRNRVMGIPLQLSNSDIQLGQSIQRGGRNSPFEFSPGGRNFNSVRVTGSTTGNSSIIGVFGTMAGIGEQTFTLPAVATNLDRDICVVVDRSGSMTDPIRGVQRGLSLCGPLSNNSKFAALVRAIDIFVAELNATPQTEHVCLASYSTNTRFDCRCCAAQTGVDSDGNPIIDPCRRIANGCGGRVVYTVSFREAEIHSVLGPNPSALQGPVRDMLARGIGGGTAIGSGLFAGIQAVTGTNSRPFAVPTIVLLTDGNQNSGPSPLVAAAAAQSAGIVVHTITFGDSADRALMQQVASQTGGTFLHASDEAALQSAFRELARTLPVLLTQ